LPKVKAEDSFIVDMNKIQKKGDDKDNTVENAFTTLVEVCEKTRVN